MKSDDALYEAERAVFHRRMPTRLTDPQEYVNHVIDSNWWHKRYPSWGERTIQVVVSKHDSAWSIPADNKIYLPSWACCDFVALHEIAHFPNIRYKENHGLEWRRTHLALTSRFMGKDVARCYRYSMKAFDLEI